LLFVGASVVMVVSDATAMVVDEEEDEDEEEEEEDEDEDEEDGRTRRYTFIPLMPAAAGTCSKIISRRLMGKLPSVVSPSYEALARMMMSSLQRLDTRAQTHEMTKS